MNRFSLTRPVAVGAALLLSCGWSCGSETAITKLRQETRELLRQEAVAQDGPPKEIAAQALCDLYVILRSDDRFADSEMLQGDAAKVRRRLINIARRRESKLKRAGVTRPSEMSGEVDSAIQSALSNQSSISQLLAPRQNNGAAAGGGLFDNGWQLVELIQRVVAPDFWEERGGPGTIRYFAMRRVLVVRATSDVHEQIKDLLIALR